MEHNYLFIEENLSTYQVTRPLTDDEITNNADGVLLIIDLNTQKEMIDGEWHSLINENEL